MQGFVQAPFGRELPPKDKDFPQDFFREVWWHIYSMITARKIQMLYTHNTSEEIQA